MIVILCDNWEDAQMGFQIFLDFLENLIDFEGWGINEEILKVFESSFGLKTNYLTYIFTHFKMKSQFERMNPEYVDADDFFNEPDSLLM